MTTYNLIRSTLAATLALSVLAACDGRGVTAMKSRMYTAEERAQAKREGRKLLPETTTPAGTPAAAPGAQATDDDETKINPQDHAEMKNYFEHSDGRKADIKLEQLKQIIAEQLDGKVKINALDRVRGITITPVTTVGKTAINLRAVVFLRDREQLLHLDNIVIDAATKDLVSGTSDVALTFKSPTLNDKAEAVTTNDLLVASVCLEPKGLACGNAFLILQFGRKDKLVDVAVFQLDQGMNIVNSNIGVPPKSYDEALADVQLPEPTASVAPAKPVSTEQVNQDRARHMVNQMMGRNDPFARAAAEAHDVKTAPAKPVVAPKAALPTLNAADAAKRDQMVREMLGQRRDPFAGISAKAAEAKAAAPAAAKPAAKAADVKKNEANLKAPGDFFNRPMEWMRPYFTKDMKTAEASKDVKPPAKTDAITVPPNWMATKTVMPSFD